MRKIATNIDTDKLNNIPVLKLSGHKDIMLGKLKSLMKLAKVDIAILIGDFDDKLLNKWGFERSYKTLLILDEIDYNIINDYINNFSFFK